MSPSVSFPVSSTVLLAQRPNELGFSEPSSLPDPDPLLNDAVPYMQAFEIPSDRMVLFFSSPLNLTLL